MDKSSIKGDVNDTWLCRPKSRSLQVAPGLFKATCQNS